MIEFLISVFLIFIAYRVFIEGGNGLKFILTSFFGTLSLYFLIISLNKIIFKEPFLELYDSLMLLIITLLTATYIWVKYE